MSTIFNYRDANGREQPLAHRYHRGRPDDSPGGTVLEMYLSKEELRDLPPLTVVLGDHTDMQQSLAQWISGVLLTLDVTVRWPEDGMYPREEPFTPAPITPHEVIPTQLTAYRLNLLRREMTWDLHIHPDYQDWTLKMCLAEVDSFAKEYLELIEPRIGTNVDTEA